MNWNLRAYREFVHDRLLSVWIYRIILTFVGNCGKSALYKGHALPALLSSKGQNTLSQMAGEFVAYFVLMATSFLLVIVLVAVAMGLTGFTLPEWEREGIGILFGFYVKMLPVAAVICAMQLLLFELTSDMVSGILLQFLCALSLGYLSGCFYPISFFPENTDGSPVTHGCCSKLWWNFRWKSPAIK